VIADDYDDLRQVIRIVLETSGRFEVVGEAANGRQALDLVVQLRPDLLLLDLAMPVLTGLEALPLVRAAAPATLVVMLSGLEEGPMRSQSLAAGAIAYLQKYLPPAQLVARLTEVIETPSRSA
jgi:DNA-binding NarL/FixJ family response regulator